MEKRIYRTKEETAEALADELYKRIKVHSGIMFIALSGGSTPALLFSLLSQKYGQIIDWHKVKFFWVDERMVPPEDDQCNYKMTALNLLDKVDIPEENIARVRGENDPRQEVLRYAQLIKKTVPQRNSLPAFDLILLGIGEDGHTASIFPNQMELLSSKDICALAKHPESGQFRITLTGPVINNGKALIFLSCGKGKFEILQKITQRDLSLPASHIDNRGEMFLYLDGDAASE